MEKNKYFFFNAVRMRNLPLPGKAGVGKAGAGKRCTFEPGDGKISCI